MKKILALVMAVVVLSTSAYAGLFFSKKQDKNRLSGEIVIDGSSTVYPITEAMAEEFRAENRDVRISVGVSGSGGGFKKFTVGTTDISDASRPIKNKEVKIAKENGIEYEEIAVAYDGLSVLVNKDNNFVDYLTVEELKKIWKSGSNVKYWSDVREGWPKEEIKLYGPGPDSGTFDYFTEEINGESGNIRSDYTPSEDDNVLVQGIVGEKNSLGFFGFAYYYENKDKMKVVPIDSGKGAVEPNHETIMSKEYSPLSRPLFIYINKKALSEKPQVKAFVKFYLENAMDIVPETGYVTLPQEKYDEQLSKLGLK
ncbi:phosphate ABC transporter substrate-binding protein (PhoT family) [Hypnocyclicus thermotrophus]|uniref:Phosphate-binding protein n=1 Tax=Hypnocyclicus thermotrophus TaxID=1627895 RepID=A0AA46I5R6_9FUSO|nr:PstS family phosphate ABC transporter substrate-binding protein [Hypnocyclicus thermotrophus]TDT70554.1 phosphate ABC transporter substrate-binding protein (PhoT family) [Hypnocyclicus thermotrophus]